MKVTCQTVSDWGSNNAIEDSRLRPRWATQAPFTHTRVRVQMNTDSDSYSYSCMCEWGLTMSILASFYHWAKFDWNLGCYACHIPSPIRNWLHFYGHYVKTWHHPQNRKYITYRDVAKGGPATAVSKVHKMWSSIVRFLRKLCQRTNKQTDILNTILRTLPPESSKLTQITFALIHEWLARSATLFYGV